MAEISFKGEVKASTYMEGYEDGQIVFVPVDDDGGHKVFFIEANDIINFEEIKNLNGIVTIKAKINTNVDYKQAGKGFDTTKLYAALDDELAPAYTHTPGGHTEYFS